MFTRQHSPQNLRAEHFGAGVITRSRAAEKYRPEVHPVDNRGRTQGRIVCSVEQEEE
jgi:hypothetical protein